MNAITIALIVFGCVFGGALVFRRILPMHHLGSDSQDTVKLGMGLVGTMAALVLGLLVGSAKGSYGAQVCQPKPRRSPWCSNPWAAPPDNSARTTWAT